MSHHRKSGLLARTLFVFISTALFASIATPARAQPAQPTTEISLQLIGQPVWHEPRDPLDLVIKVINDSTETLPGFRIQLRLFSAVISRSELAENLEVDPFQVETSSFLPAIRGDRLEPGAERTLRVEASIAKLTSLAGVTTPGIYPMTINLVDPVGAVTFDSVSTFLLYFPGGVQEPLRVVPVWVLGGVPERGVDGIFQADPVTEAFELEASVTRSGAVTNLLEALSTRAGSSVRMGVAATPRIIEELWDMADGYSRRLPEGDIETIGANSPVARGAQSALDGVADLLDDGRAQPLLVPYSAPDLPEIADNLTRVQQQLTNGEAALREVRDIVPGRGWIFPPGARIDAESLDALHARGGAASTFFNPEIVLPDDPEAPTCPSPFAGATYTCPIKVTTVAGTSRGYLLDTALQERMNALAGSGGGRIALQRVFAELAMIWAEQPAVSDRVIPLIVPSAWKQPPRAAHLFIRTLGRAPWIDTITPRGGLHLGIGAARREIATEERSTFIDEPAYAAAVDEAAASLADFEGLEPPPAVLTPLRRDLLVSEARVWNAEELMRQRGLSYATGVDTVIEDEFAKIHLSGQSDFTLTSLSEELPLVLFNETDYAVTLNIAIDWQSLDVEVERADDMQTFAPGRSHLPLQVTARSSGIFPVRVAIETPSGEEIESKRISIRSTQFNEVALAITLGALAFLISFYLFRGIRGRAAKEPSE